MFPGINISQLRVIHRRIQPQRMTSDRPRKGFAYCILPCCIRQPEALALSLHLPSAVHLSEEYDLPHVGRCYQFNYNCSERQTMPVGVFWKGAFEFGLHKTLLITFSCGATKAEADT